MDKYEEGLKYCLRCPDTLLGQFHAQLGKSQSLYLQKEAALLNFLEAKELFEKSNSVYWTGKTYVYLAEYYRSISQYPKATIYLQKFDDLSEKHKIPLGLQAYFYNRKAAILHESTDDIEAVVKYSNKAIEIAKSVNLPSLAASSYNELGYLYNNHGDKEKGKDYYNQALIIFKEIGDLQQYVGVLMNLIRLNRTGVEDYQNYHLALNALKLIEDLDLPMEKGICTWSFMFIICT